MTDNGRPDRMEEALPTAVADGLIAENFTQALREFTEHTTARGFVLWLEHPNRLLGDQPPLEVLRNDPRGYERVAEAARMWVDSEGQSNLNPELLDSPGGPDQD